MKKTMSVGYISAAGKTSQPRSTDRYDLYNEEKKALKAEFAGLQGQAFDWNDPGIRAKLSGFAKTVIQNTQQTVIGTPNLWDIVLPTENIEPGDTFKLREIHGVNIYYGTYGGAVRMSRPQFTDYSATTRLKEVGVRLDLTSIRTGKYSPSELADYTSSLITAWRNHLLFTTTLGGMSVYQSGGAQYVASGAISFSTMNLALNKVTDEGDVRAIVGRRQAILALSTAGQWSEAGKAEFERTGQVGYYAGIPVYRVYSFTDPDYGTVYPMVADQLWIFSDLPAGRAVVADTLRTSDEVVMSNEAMNIYFRWDDGIGIFKTNRIALIDNIT